ncbi:hypothetical protein KIH74_21755 [Kineosporia sp. J2-2]|uniref:Uncharacterized protein n=1 Tax=Kineosporia corallincola TaxID=2835133 RepID=A0ABS5TPQ4_9ACTN|nr:hypothetical protein [Kineosporia corallincola]MBT0771579.1 hypothetical protein [Kineosporia corallincola]
MIPFVTLDDDGTPLRFHHRGLPRQPFLLQPGRDRWHTAEHRWGSGFAVTGRGSGRWRTAGPVTGDLRVDIERDVSGDVLTETYRWTNTGTELLDVTGLGITVPLRDVYESAAQAVESAVHAHVWTGGQWAWVLARPMSGQGPVLGLVVRTGALWAYSIESRNPNTLSNVRGHIVLQPTDRARNPGAFGGQPVIRLDPGESYELTWDVRFYVDVPAFLAATDPPVTIDRFAAEEGTPILVDGKPLSGRGYTYVGNDRYRTAVLFHRPRRELVERRVRFVLDHQRATERPEPDRHAFLPYDNRSGLTQPTAAWADWSDGAERLAMPSLLQQARLRGWGDTAELDAALHGWAAFARARLITAEQDVLWGSDTPADRIRLYNFPWLAEFFATQYEIYRRPDDLELAATLLERAYEIGAAQHLLIGHAEAVLHVAGLLPDGGRARALRRWLKGHAKKFAAAGANLPAHEVNYEQSMVAPLVTLLALAAPDSPALHRALAWMRAFGGPQPHVRLHGIGIRHWDGYWFGRDRLWGDTFPHHWSVLTAVALLQNPHRTAADEAEAEAIFRAATVDFADDGSASSAFVMPSSVDGRPAHAADPLANDQDWALVLWLRSMP